MTSTAPDRPPLADRVAALDWYHTIDLPGGVTTPGMFDTRPTVPKVPLPDSLEGKRCLDVGTWDGFWAFEMERRGAAEVVAIDLADQARWDWPPETRLAGYRGGLAAVEEFKGEQSGFRLAHEALGSRVDHRELSVYDLSRDEAGTFDFVFLGSLLLHLRDPVRALDRLREVCTGEAVIADTVDAIPSLLRPRTPTARLEGMERPWWWIPNRAAFHQMVRSAGFEILDATGLYIVPIGVRHPRTPVRQLWRNPFGARGREELIIRFRGIPHTAVRARPMTAA